LYRKVTNEGKDIFYAKNKLGMTDKVLPEMKIEQPLFPDWLTEPI
jgi:hypothetical protein